MNLLFQTHNGQILHIETRNTDGGAALEAASGKLDALLRLDIKQGSLINLVKTLKRSSFLTSVQLLSTKSTSVAKSKEISNITRAPPLSTLC